MFVAGYPSSSVYILDIAQAVERALEAKGLADEDLTARGVKILRALRSA